MMGLYVNILIFSVYHPNVRARLTIGQFVSSWAITGRRLSCAFVPSGQSTAMRTSILYPFIVFKKYGHNLHLSTFAF
jgi:hypothetical protein